MRWVPYRWSMKMSAAQSARWRIARPEPRAHNQHHRDLHTFQLDNKNREQLTYRLVCRTHASYRPQGSAPWENEQTSNTHKFSYSSFPASAPAELVLCSRTYFIRAWSSADPRFANGRPTIATARARPSEKFRPSESFAPTTAKRSAPE